MEAQHSAPTYSDTVVRTFTDLQHWGHMGMSGVEYTVTYAYPDAPDETHHLRIARRPEGTWMLYRLTRPHGDVDDSAPFAREPINARVIARILDTPGAIVSGAPTRAFVEAFYATPTPAPVRAVCGCEHIRHDLDNALPHLAPETPRDGHPIFTEQDGSHPHAYVGEVCTTCHTTCYA